MRTFTLTADGGAQTVVSGLSQDARTFGLRWIQIGCCTFSARLVITHTNTDDEDEKSFDYDIGLDRAQYGVGSGNGRFEVILGCNNNCAVLRRLKSVTIQPRPGNGCGSVENTYKLCMCTCTNQTFNSRFPSDTATCDSATCAGKYVVA